MENSVRIFTEEDIANFSRLPYPQREFRIRDIWNERADKQRIGRNTLIHWRYYEDVKYLLQNPDISSEISCSASSSALTASCLYVGGVGVVLKGTITLAGDSDLGTRLVRRQHTVVKVTSAYDRLMSGHEERAPYEVALSHWSPEGIIVDLRAMHAAREEQGRTVQSRLDAICDLSNRTGVPFINSCYRLSEQQSMGFHHGTLTR